jgi:ABC-type polar amino acid transport system ATPase subunit
MIFVAVQVGLACEVMSETAVALPDPALVVLVGPSGSGKSVWAAGRYRAEEVVSSLPVAG